MFRAGGINSEWFRAARYFSEEHCVSKVRVQCIFAGHLTFSVTAFSIYANYLTFAVTVSISEILLSH